MKRIYLDHAATTPVLPEVADAMAQWIRGEYGNPSSLYEEGRRARAAIDVAREAVSDALGCLFAEVLFTSSGTESANLAIVGAALASPAPTRNRVLFGAAEHHCVLNTAGLLKRLGFAVELVPVNREALIDLDALEKTLADDVLLVSVMHANNELGTLQPVAQVAQLAHARGALFHCDAVQTFCGGLLRWTVEQLGADLISICAHKIYGPKGVGALFVKAGTRIKPIIYGGAHERENRAGTENVAGIVGFAEAVRMWTPSRGRHLRGVRDAFVQALEENAPQNLRPTVTCAEVLPGHSHLRFEGVSAETMLIKLDRLGISAGSGAACSSGSLEPSHVLLACGYRDAQAREALRFTFGIENTVAEAGKAARLVAEAATNFRPT